MFYAIIDWGTDFGVVPYDYDTRELAKT